MLTCSRGQRGKEVAHRVADGVFHKTGRGMVLHRRQPRTQSEVVGVEGTAIFLFPVG